MRLVGAGATCHHWGMHTHFGSATHLASTFLGVLIAGTLWRIGNLRILAYASKKNSKHLAGLAQAALGQY